jgi:serine/threonine protein kinase
MITARVHLMPDPFSPDSGGLPPGQRPDPQEDFPTLDPRAFLFNRYHVEREIGRGGMGVVLLARDSKLGNAVAIKMVPELVVKDEEAINDLRREVLRGMALMHPGIVRTHYFERDETRAAIVMEFIDGHTLGELKARQPGHCFDPEQIIGWLEQLCLILDYAHYEAKIAHRDLKPRNVMITLSGKVKVADFGVAASISDSLSRVSVRNNASGTPPYMSPQQARGTTPTHLDDIYALGATIYELLTSKPPFFRGNILFQVLEQIPPTMAERRLELHIAGKSPIPSSWERAIAACLAKEPSERPQSAGAFFTQLRTATSTSIPLPLPRHS